MSTFQNPGAHMLLRPILPRLNGAGARNAAGLNHPFTPGSDTCQSPITSARPLVGNPTKELLADVVGRTGALGANSGYLPAAQQVIGDGRDTHQEAASLADPAN